MLVQLYQFKKKEDGPNKGFWYNPLFRRDCSFDELKKVKPSSHLEQERPRKRLKQAEKENSSNNASMEPDTPEFVLAKSKKKDKWPSKEPRPLTHRAAREKANDRIKMFSKKSEEDSLSKNESEIIEPGSISLTNDNVASFDQTTPTKPTASLENKMIYLSTHDTEVAHTNDNYDFNFGGGSMDILTSAAATFGFNPVLDATEMQTILGSAQKSEQEVVVSSPAAVKMHVTPKQSWLPSPVVSAKTVDYSLTDSDPVGILFTPENFFPGDETQFKLPALTTTPTMTPLKISNASAFLPVVDEPLAGLSGEPHQAFVDVDGVANTAAV